MKKMLQTESGRLALAAAELHRPRTLALAAMLAALNLALNLLGCYVHDLRLQCLEFFNRFYKEGGKPYKPLAIQTKYVDVIKEEQ